MGGKIIKDRLTHPLWNPTMINLGVTRALGDFYFKSKKYVEDKESGLICDPSITTVFLKASDNFLLIASDGLWETVTPEEVNSFVLNSSKKDPNMICKELTQMALIKGASDNITVVLVLFKQNDLEKGSSSMSDGASETLDQSKEEKYDKKRKNSQVSNDNSSFPSFSETSNKKGSTENKNNNNSNNDDNENTFSSSKHLSNLFHSFFNKDSSFDFSQHPSPKKNKSVLPSPTPFPSPSHTPSHSPSRSLKKSSKMMGGSTFGDFPPFQSPLPPQKNKNFGNSSSQFKDTSSTQRKEEKGGEKEENQRFPLLPIIPFHPNSNSDPSQAFFVFPFPPPSNVTLDPCNSSQFPFVSIPFNPNRSSFNDPLLFSENQSFNQSIPLHFSPHNSPHTSPPPSCSPPSCSSSSSLVHPLSENNTPFADSSIENKPSPSIENHFNDLLDASPSFHHDFGSNCDFEYVAEEKNRAIFYQKDDKKFDSSTSFGEFSHLGHKKKSKFQK